MPLFLPALAISPTMDQWPFSFQFLYTLIRVHPDTPKRFSLMTVPTPIFHMYLTKLSVSNRFIAQLSMINDNFPYSDRSTKISGFFIVEWARVFRV